MERVEIQMGATVSHVNPKTRHLGLNQQRCHQPQSGLVFLTTTGGLHFSFCDRTKPVSNPRSSTTLSICLEGTDLPSRALIERRKLLAKMAFSKSSCGDWVNVSCESGAVNRTFKETEKDQP
jgi:hypothetical protein